MTNSWADSRAAHNKELCKIHIFLSQENIILVENIAFRSSPLRVAGKPNKEIVATESMLIKY